MSTDTSSSAGISQRISKIESKANEAKDIQQRIEREEKERQRAERKNRAFKKLNKTLEDIDDERARLVDWIQLARAMDVEFNEVEIQDTVDRLERELDSFTASDYQNFSDAAEINDLREETFDGFRTDIQGHANTIQSSVEAKCGSLKEQIKRTQTALRIPDLGDPGDEEQLNEILQFLTHIQQGELPSNATEQWQRLEAKYDEIELSLDGVQSRFDLSEETIGVIRRFLDDEAVMLSELDSDVLNELQTFEEFSKRLAIRFKEES